MLYTHITQKLLGLQGVIIKNIESDDKNIVIYAELERKPHSCPCCCSVTDTVHDYRKQSIKDIPAFGKLVNIVLRKRRYRCPCCEKDSLKAILFCQSIIDVPIGSLLL